MKDRYNIYKSESADTDLYSSDILIGTEIKGNIVKYSFPNRIWKFFTAILEKFNDIYKKQNKYILKLIFLKL